MQVLDLVVAEGSPARQSLGGTRVYVEHRRDVIGAVDVIPLRHPDDTTPPADDELRATSYVVRVQNGDVDRIDGADTGEDEGVVAHRIGEFVAGAVRLARMSDEPFHGVPGVGQTVWREGLSRGLGFVAQFRPSP